MSKNTKQKYVHWLLGSSTSVLDSNFVNAFKNDEFFNLYDWLPFSTPSKPKLPTKIDVLKLVLFFRDECGRKNSWVPKGDIWRSAASSVLKYWSMSGFQTVTNVPRKVQNLFSEYDKLRKDQKLTGDKFVKRRDDFMEEGYKLFDIATPDLEVLLEKDRILGNVGGCSQDIAFYRDQKGPRLGHMGKVDTEFVWRKQAAAKRKLSDAGSLSTESTSMVSGSEDTGGHDIGAEDSGPEETTEESTDVNFNPSKPKRRTKTVLVELPRDLLGASPDITAALDRNKSSNKAVLETLGATLKAGSIGGKPVDLNEFVLSAESIRLKRAWQREVICRVAAAEFKRTMPRWLAVHWDSKMMSDISNELREVLAILVSGAPDYVEGKLIGMSV